LRNFARFRRSGWRQLSAHASDFVVRDPRSIFANAFRSLRAALIHSAGNLPGVVMVSSALSNEGKTTVATCLARVFAQGGAEVVLVDCDAAQPSLSRRLCPPDRRQGLMEVLRGEAALDDVLVRDRSTAMHILPIAYSPENAGELLTGEQMADLLSLLRRRFTYVVIDSAPLLAVAETRVLATMADAVVMVMRWRHTPDHAIKTALRQLAMDQVKIAGAVLSCIDLRKQGRFGRGDATFYHKSHKAYYA
jgi:capsular exopolysaccharide synthesis family protein